MYMSCPCFCCPLYHFCRTQIMSPYRPKHRKTARKVDAVVRQKQFTMEELAQYDGSGGKPAYAAVNGMVYDVSFNGAWGGGTHFGLYSGKDLTAQFEGCHNGSAILEKLPKVGILIK